MSEETIRLFKKWMWGDGEWKCPFCGHNEFWFDRTISFDSNGNEIGMLDRCVKCGKSEEEEQMTDKKVDDGGFVYPFQRLGVAGNPVDDLYPGMTVRQLGALMAIQGYRANNEYSEYKSKDIADMALEDVDALIAEERRTRG